jgi:PAS domain S-box-containing protein
MENSSMQRLSFDTIESTEQFLHSFAKKSSHASQSSNDVESTESSFNDTQILLATIFPLFLESAEYINFVDSSDSAEHLQKLGIALPTVDSTREERLDHLFESDRSPINEVFSEAAISIDEIEIQRLLTSGEWVIQLLTCIENLHLCVSLSTARLNRPGFPLVYVNKAFEETTGYRRSEIVGHNCKFLQSEKSEPEQILLISNALAYAQPVKTTLTNKRKDSQEFFNLLSMKPIFDKHGSYSYVIGVQYHLSTGVEDIKLIDDLLSIFPNILQ